MNDRPRLNFLSYTLMLYQSGMVALGKADHPLLGKKVYRAEEARGVIELLELLLEKTAGNRTTEEDTTIDMVIRTLTELQKEAAGTADTPLVGPTGGGVEIH